jgi:hypothetical protein
MTIPRFPEFKAIELEDRDIIQRAMDLFPSEVCELNFGNTFIWRNFDHPKATFIRDNLCLFCEPPDEPAYFLQPMGAREIPETLRDCLAFAPRLSRIPAAFAARFCPGFRCASDRNNFDYVYRSRDLIELKGKKFDGKRNRISKFVRDNDFHYLKLSPEHLEACRRLFEEWMEEKAVNGSMISAQKDAIEQALTHFAALGLAGSAIEVGGNIEAFSIGEKLNRETAVIHIEIVNPRYDGLSQLLNRESIKNEWSGFPFINREQDLGIPGLRRAKMSYHPDHLVEKSVILA